jgi:hypothetical protein
MTAFAGNHYRARSRGGHAVGIMGYFTGAKIKVAGLLALLARTGNYTKRYFS